MTKREFVTRLADLLGTTWKDAERLGSTVFEELSKTVAQHGRFVWPGFGVWSIRTRKARRIQNPQTRAPMRLRATKTVGFRASKELRSRLKGRRAA